MRRSGNCHQKQKLASCVLENVPWGLSGSEAAPNRYRVVHEHTCHDIDFAMHTRRLRTPRRNSPLRSNNERGARFLFEAVAATAVFPPSARLTPHTIPCPQHNARATHPKLCAIASKWNGHTNTDIDTNIGDATRSQQTSVFITA